jgi:hypothetical protein
MQRDREHLRELAEVAVSREDRKVLSCRDGTDQEVCVRALNALPAATVEVRRGFFVVGGRDLDIRKRAQMFAQSLVLSD